MDKKPLGFCIAILALCLLGVPSGLLAQQAALGLVPDSLVPRLLALPSDTARMKWLNDKAYAVKNQNPALATTLCQASLSLQQATPISMLEADALSVLGNVADNQGQTDRALAYYQQALAVLRHSPSLPMQASLLNNIGLVLQRQKKLDSALVYLSQALEIKRKLGNERSYASTLNNLGLVNLDKLQYVKALQYFLESLLIKEKYKDVRGMGNTLLNIANIYRDMGLLDSSEAVLRRTIVLRKQIDDTWGLASSYSNLALIEKRLGRMREALASLAEAEAYARQVNDAETLARITDNRADIYLELAQPRLGLEHARQALAAYRTIGNRHGMVMAHNSVAKAHLALGKPTLALAELKRALRLADSIQDVAARQLTLKMMVEAKARQQSDTSALATLEAYQHTQDSLVHRDLARELGSLQQSYVVLSAQAKARELAMQSRLKDASLRQLALEAERQRYATFSLLTMFCLGLVAFGVLWYVRGLRQKQLLLSTRAAATAQERTRIARDLHDELGTSLSRIALSADTSLLLHGTQPVHQQATLEQIGTLARQVLHNLGDLVWDLQQDQAPASHVFERLTENLAAYLDEASVEHTLRLHPGQDLQLTGEQQRHIQLIVREAVHNALRHGRPTHVQAHARVAGGWLGIAIADNGAGFDPLNRPERPLSDLPGGNGLGNMRQRAAALGGSLHIQSEPGLGTLLVLVVPMQGADKRLDEPHPFMRPSFADRLWQPDYV